MNIKLVKAIDTVIGRGIVLFAPKPSAPALYKEPCSILIVRPGGIGDAVLLAPAIGLLKKRYPQAEITVLAEKRNAGVFALIPVVDRLLRYDVRGELLAAFRRKPDVVIDTEQWHRLSAVVARLTGAATLIGYATNERARLFHHAIPYSHDDYEAVSFMHLLAPLGIRPLISIFPPFLSVPAPAQARATQLLAPLAGQPFVALFPGASIPERRWGAERFGQVAAHLAKQGYGVVVVGGPDDVAAGAEIISVSAGLNLAGQSLLAETAAILEHSALLISGDSGILHLGVGLGIPTVSLFGPGIAKKWAPLGPQHLVLDHHLSCSPCTRFGYTQKCHRNSECMMKISSDEVFQAAIKQLK